MGDLFVVKYLSALSSTIMATIVIPIQGVFFLWPLLAGPATKDSLSYWTILSILVTMFGVFLFGLTPNISQTLKGYSLSDNFKRKQKTDNEQEEEKQQLLGN